MRLCMVGAGYVGLVSGAGFAEMGNQVICADVDRAKIARLKAGEIPIFEPGLEELVERNVAGGRLGFTDVVEPAIAASQVVFVTVGTPGVAEGGLDVCAVEGVARAVTRHARGETVLVLKSTVPPGTNERVRAIVADAPHPVHVVSNPEFLKEGDAIKDFLWPDRIVVGCHEDDAFARETMKRLYAPLCRERDRMLFMDPVSAELTKYVGNTLLAMRISFMNEISALCERLGADIHSVRVGVGTDPRIGGKFLYAGPGYGGSCFPKDVRALMYAGRQHGVELELVAATDRVNQRQKGVLLRKLREHLGRDLRGRKIGVWGIAFKPRTDDVRESPALTLIESLLAERAHVAAHDPAKPEAALARFEGRVRVVDDAYEAAVGADALVLVTEWCEYQNPDFERLRATMRHPLLVDGRNVWSSYGLRKLGFRYAGIGVRGS